MHIHDMVFDGDTDEIYAVGHGKIVVWQMSVAAEAAEEAATS